MPATPAMAQRPFCSSALRYLRRQAAAGSKVTRYQLIDFTPAAALPRALVAHLALAPVVDATCAAQGHGEGGGGTALPQLCLVLASCIIAAW